VLHRKYLLLTQSGRQQALSEQRCQLLQCPRQPRGDGNNEAA